MERRQRLGAWAAAVAAAFAAAAIVLRACVPVSDWVELRMPALAPPDRAAAFTPGLDGATPLLLVVENTPNARPQSGLTEACLVYALPAEARITRFLATHCSAAPEAVGPIRSARAYMLDLAADLGAVLVHAGGSADALERIRRERLSTLNELWTAGPFWRDPQRRMPHNLYTRIDRLREHLAGKPHKSPPVSLPYRFEEPASAGGPAPVLEALLDYGPPYSVRYRYDAGGDRYLREQDGAPHVDAGGRQIAPTSVIVLFVRWWDVWVGGAPSSRIALEGGGQAVVLSRGTLSPASWSRKAGGSLAVNDAAGSLVTLPAGPVWIELFPRDRPFMTQSQ